MTTTPVLTLPDFINIFVIQMDASGYRMRVVLLQEGHPICYFSKKICPKLQSSSTYVRELHAIIRAI